MPERVLPTTFPVRLTDAQPEGPRATYDAGHFAPLFAAEDRHFWFRRRNACIGAATALIPDRDSIREIVEHGCGTGFVLAELQRLFPGARVTGVDLFAEGLAFAGRRFAGRLVQADVLQSGFHECFDLAGFFDVLEHLDDDLQALQALARQLRPGGWLLLTVPAHMSLWSDYDMAAGHRRRYSRPELEAQLEKAGFAVEYCTPFMSALVPLIWIRRRFFRRGASSSVSASTEDELKIHPLANRLLETLLRPETCWIRHRRRLPAGASLLALARKMPASRR